MKGISIPLRYNFLYLCNQLISLVVYITQFMLGVASIGTGTKRFISFFIARPATQTASSSPNVADWFAHRTVSDCRTNQLLSRPDAQSLPKSDSLPATNSVATPTVSNQPHLIRASANLVRYCTYNQDAPLIASVEGRRKLISRWPSQIDPDYFSAFGPNKACGRSQPEDVHVKGGGQYRSKIRLDCCCASG